MSADRMQGAGFEYIVWALEQPLRHGLKPRETVLLYVLAIRAGDDGESWHGIKTLAKQCNLSRGTVNEAIKGLERHGLLTHEARYGRSSVYRLLKADLPTRVGSPCPACEAAAPAGDGSKSAHPWAGGSPPVWAAPTEPAHPSGQPPSEPAYTGGQPGAAVSGSPDGWAGVAHTGGQGLPIRVGRELPRELPKELPTESATENLSSEGQQEVARAWVEQNRNRWAGVDAAVAMSVALEGLAEGQPLGEGHVIGVRVRGGLPAFSKGGRR